MTLIQIKLILLNPSNKLDRLVEIEMEDVFVKKNEHYIYGLGIGNHSTHSKKPKLDAYGCLI